jgi:DNA polymerase III delta subunit
MVYLFIGEDSPSKNTQISRIKQQFFSKELEQFNLDILYARELTLVLLQERLLCLPVKAKKRLIVIKEAQALKEGVKEFLLEYAKKPRSQIILILDVECWARKDEFINQIYKYAKTFRFKETIRPDTFTLNRQIELGRPDYALRVLSQILKEGERPERILGGLRYAWERGVGHPITMRKKLGLLLNCDIDIKTGRLKPVFALEKLVISLCSLGKSFH